jgi:simple sugar transport system permease protein
LKKSVPGYIRKFLIRPEGSALVAALVVFIVFSVFGKNFLSASSIKTMLIPVSEQGIVAVAITLLMIGGEFDLSVGSVWGLSATLVILMANSGFPLWTAILIMLVIGVAIGLLQGLIVVKVGIPSFIVTLAGLMFWRGIILVIGGVGSYGIRFEGDDSFLKIFSYKFANGFSVSILWFILVAAILALILQRTRFGNWIYATGGNKMAARQSGVPIDRVKMILFIISATLASLGGIVQTARFGSADPLRGQNLELIVIAMAVVGGNRLFGGYGSVIGTILGIVTLSMIENGMVLMSIPSFWFQGFLGGVILITVIINTITQRRATGVSRE